MTSSNPLARRLAGRVMKAAAALGLIAAVAAAAIHSSEPSLHQAAAPPERAPLSYDRRRPVDTSGYSLITANIPRWQSYDTLEEISDCWKGLGGRVHGLINRYAATKTYFSQDEKVNLLIDKALAFNYDGEPANAYETLEKARTLAEADDRAQVRWLSTLMYLQGVVAMRLGENENCVMCRGESSCILPISPAAVHRKPRGSRLAIRHFSEYLDLFPDDLDARWLLNLAHMTLGEHPEGVDPRFRISLDRYRKSEFDIGKFRDVGHLAGVNLFNQAGGAVMEDFDNDGLLDLAVTSFDPTQRMTVYHNKGDGTFDDRTESAGVANQLGGLYCVQTDYNNDGNMDLYIPRGAWVGWPMRPSLLRNNGNGGFTDVTEESGLLDPVNSNSATWGDYDNDGFLDLFVCCERQANRLYHNRGNGVFDEVALPAGVDGGRNIFCKGATWLDFDNDRYPDLFLNYMSGKARLFRNNRDGTFTDVSKAMGIDGPMSGFSCWAWDYDNDGWVDIFATCYERTLTDVVKGLIGQPHERQSNRLFRNRQGKGFENVTKDAGLDLVFASMGSNFADFDNDGFLDFYLGTGEPNLATLIPNRMFKNVGGKRFAEITGTSGTGHLQKGHAVVCGDYDRDGDLDLFVQTGGAVNGDKYHNVLFENPGQGNHWLGVKLIGQKTNRAAIGTRIKAITAGEKPQTVYRHVSSGSSFGANPLEQTIGLAKADRVTRLEIEWPTSGTTQIFRDIAADQVIEITEFATEYRKREVRPVRVVR